MDDVVVSLNEILKKYNIGKKPLSKILGWGETTVMNQLNGASPNREFAKTIKRLSEDPYYFSELLEKNRGKVTDVAYRKAKKAVQKLVECDKAALISFHIIKSLNSDVAPYQIMASLFYGQAVCLIKNGYPLINDDVVYRPGKIEPYPDIYEKLKSHDFWQMCDFDESIYKQEKEIALGICKILNGYSPNAVMSVLKSDRTSLVNRHRAAGLTTEEETRTGIRISLSETEQYFKNENKKNPLTDPDGFKTYIDEKLLRRQKRKKKA